MVKNHKYLVMVFVLITLLLAPAAALADNANQKPLIIYYANGDWEYTPVTVMVDGGNEITDGLNQLMQPKSLPPDCYDEFPDGITVKACRIENQIAYIELDETALTKADQDSYCIPLMKSIIGYNLIQRLPDLKAISFSSANGGSSLFGKVLRSDLEPDLTSVIQGDKLELDLSQLEGKTPEEINAFFNAEILKRHGNRSLQYTTYKVCLDPGHGGSESGALGYYNGTEYKEKDLNLDFGLQAQTDLLSRRNPSFNVYMTRTDNSDVTLSERVNTANSNGVKCFVSIHCNSSTNTQPNGATALYSASHDVANSQSLANLEIYWIVEDTSLSKHRDAYQDSFYVINNTQMPATIVEVGFMSNSSDLGYLINNAQDIGHAIGEATSRYCQLY